MMFESIQNKTQVLIILPKEQEDVQKLCTWWYAPLHVLGKPGEWKERTVAVQQALATENPSTQKVAELLCDLLSKEYQKSYTTFPQKGQYEEDASIFPRYLQLIRSSTYEEKNHPDLMKAAMRAHYAMAKLTDSAWTPHKPLADLMKEVKTQGPHVVFGFFGEPFYRQGQMVQTTFCERTVWGWKAGAERTEEKQIRAVILVGLWLTEKEGRVYFIDPQTPHDPLTKERKIYVISTKNFTTHITNDVGELFSAVKSDDHITPNPIFTSIMYDFDKWPKTLTESKSIYAYRP